MQIGAFTGEGMALGLESSAGRIATASESLIPATPARAGFASPRDSGLGFAGALDAAAARSSSVSWTIEYNDHSTSNEDKQAKLLRAQTVAAKRG